MRLSAQGWGAAALVHGDDFLVAGRRGRRKSRRARDGKTRVSSSSRGPATRRRCSYKIRNVVWGADYIDYNIDPKHTNTITEEWLEAEAWPAKAPGVTNSVGGRTPVQDLDVRGGEGATGVEEVAGDPVSRLVRPRWGDRKRTHQAGRHSTQSGGSETQLRGGRPVRPRVCGGRGIEENGDPGERQPGEHPEGGQVHARPQVQ